MLPIFRTVTVGGVLLAILLLALALSPPGRTQTQFSGLDAPARGVMIDAAAHPEWRQFIILAAFQRATELNRLRELPDTPAQLPEIPFVAPDYVPPQFTSEHPPAGSQSKTSSTARYAGLPTAHDDTRSDDDTGSLKATPEATMPIDIGEPSSTELPVTPSESTPPVLTVPVTEAPPADNPPVATMPVAMPAVTMVPATAPVAPAAPPKKTPRHHRAKARPPSTVAHAQTNAAPASVNPTANFFSAWATPPATAAEASSKKATRKTVAHTKRHRTRTATTSQAISR